MIKLIATDMDGTFLDSNKKFDKEFIDLFYQLKDKGIKFVIASGNQYYRLYQKFLPMSEDMYFIAENGSYIAEGSKEIYSNVIKPEHILKVREIIASIPRIAMVMCGKKGAYMLEKHIQYKNEVQKYFVSFQFVKSYDDIDDEIMKCSLLDTLYKTDEIVGDIQSQLPDGLRIVTAGNEWMDIQNFGIHKGKGIQLLQKKYNIAFDECAAFGDQMNDYELLQSVKYAYAMSNAVEPIKEIAYEVVLSNDEQGVIQKMKEILKKERPMRLIMRADDLGFSEGVNHGIYKAIKDGVITCVALMSNMEAAKHGYELVKDTGICLGMHTNICAGKPVLNPSLIPSLVQENGEFYPSRHFHSRKEDTVVLEEVEMEIEAQLRRFMDITGKKPDYFECHAVSSENFFIALKNVAKKYDLFYENPLLDVEWEKENGIKAFGFQKLNEQGLYDPRKYMEEHLDDLKNNDCCLAIFHPGYLDQYILEHSSFTKIRAMECEFLCSDWLKNWIKDNRIELVDFLNYK